MTRTIDKAFLLATTWILIFMLAVSAYAMSGGGHGGGHGAGFSTGNNSSGSDSQFPVWNSNANQRTVRPTTDTDIHHSAGDALGHATGHTVQEMDTHHGLNGSVHGH